MSLRQAESEERSAVRPKPTEAASQVDTPHSTSTSDAAPPPPQLLALKIRGTQTLIQPDAPPNVILPHPTPIPFIMVWNAQVAPVKPTVSTLPEQALLANEQPSLNLPNREFTPLPIKIAATPFQTEAPMPKPSTTSPLIVSKADAPTAAPQNLSNAIGASAPARIISLSDIELKDGTIAVPLANSVARSAPTDSTSLLRANGTDPGASGAAVTHASGPPASVPSTNSAGNTSAATGTAKVDSPGKPVAVAETGNSAATPIPGTGIVHVDERAITRIHHPKNGQFGVVVVGSALAEEYPEANELWGGRLVYTVYLHVGTGKNWILQYSLPRSADAASAGTSIRPEPPWPYELARPTPSEEGLDADALMVHGYVTTEGRFDKTSVVFPSGFANAKTLLEVLDIWQFRPAQQNGQAARVEVILIIPAESE